MSERSTDKRTIMDYLPEHERAKVRKLAERLAEETAEKEKYKRLYEQMGEKYQELAIKCRELEEHNSDLKSQIATSKMAINKARQAYIASRSAKKTKKQRSDPENDDNQQTQNIDDLKQTWMKMPKLPHTHENFKDESIFQNENNQSNSNYIFKALEKGYPSLPLPIHNQNSGLLKSGKKLSKQVEQVSSKKQQILNLRKQIEDLTEQMKKKEASSLPFNEKIKKCEEIKNRYLVSKQKRKRKKEATSSEEEGQNMKQPSHYKQTNSKEQNVNPDYGIRSRGSQPWKEAKETKQQQEGHERSQMLDKRERNDERAGTTKSKDLEGGLNAKSRKQSRRNEPQMKFDESLTAIIDQLNFGN